MIISNEVDFKFFLIINGSVAFKKMKFYSVFLVMICSLSCSVNYDHRLNGTWISNKEETLKVAFKAKPNWHNCSQERKEKFGNIFGHMKITYDKNRIIMNWKDDKGSFTYRVVEKGKDYVVIETKGEFMEGDKRIEFTPDLNGYFIDTGLGYPEKFDRITTEQVNQAD